MTAPSEEPLTTLQRIAGAMLDQADDYAAIAIVARQEGNGLETGLGAKGLTPSTVAVLLLHELARVIQALPHAQKRALVAGPSALAFIVLGDQLREAMAQQGIVCPPLGVAPPKDPACNN